jgi:phage terminase small subunit
MQISSISGGDGLPPEPDWSSIYSDELDIAEAHEQWGIVTRELVTAGTISVANGHSIKRLVEFRVQYERAARHVAEKGAILAPTSKKAKVGQWNPFWSVMRQADESIRVMEAELGIAPVRRGKATKVQRGKKATRAADEFRKPVS